MFDKPQAGKFVEVITDWSVLYSLHVDYSRINNSIQADRGKVIPSEDYDDPESFRLTTGRPEFPVAVIPLKHVIKLSYTDGTEAKSMVRNKLDDTETWIVPGSKGQYVVMRKGELWSCECAGWGFRGQCKHVTTKKQEVLDRINQ